ncbi:MAG TPA: hypothetical protein DDX98_04580 [Bacteroidales bacterium]|nr:hypothetical protein [Bacteroidales bacterium]
MPGFDRTGPKGQGSQTGRKLGKCNPPKEDSSEQLDANETRSGKGRRLGRGVGKGFGLSREAGRGLGRRKGRGNT